MKSMMIAVAAMLLAGCAADAADDQPEACAPRNMIAEILAADFGETPVTMTRLPGGYVAEVWLSSRGSWSVLLTQPDGVACILRAAEPVKGQPA